MSHLPDKFRAVNIEDVVEIRPDISDDTAYPQLVIPREFKRLCEERGDKTALVACTGKTYSWKEYYENSHNFARALVTLGIKAFDAVTIIGFNSPEYMFAVMGAIEAGGVATGIYATNTPDACFYVMDHCKSTVIVVDGATQLGKILEIRHKLPCLRKIIVYNASKIQLPASEEGYADVCTWENFIQTGSSSTDSVISQRVESQKPGQCLSLIYTSGTTGNPKAVMISHDNVGFVCQVIREDFNLGEGDRIVSFLPLSHIAAQMIDIFASSLLGMTVYYARPDALKGSLVNTLREARPTVFVTVPRVFEKMAESVSAKLSSATGIKRWIASFCRRRGIIHMNNIQVGSRKQSLWFYGLARKLLLDKVKATLGLDAAKILFSAAAPIDLSTLQFFASFDIPVFEIFGMSESTGPVTFHTVGQWRIGTTGRAMRGSIVKAVPGTQEIIVTGRHVFMGYLNMPEDTRRAIDDDGYLHSGDCGSVDSDGFWKVTGRLKELIVTAGGENIPPVLIEAELKNLAPSLSNVVLIGDKRKYLTVLLTLQCSLPGDGNEEGVLLGASLDLAKQLNSSARTVTEASKDPLFLQYFTDVIQQYNAHAFSNAQK